MVQTKRFVSTLGLRVVVDHRINVDEFHKTSLLYCNFFIWKPHDPNNDAYDFREVHECVCEREREREREIKLGYLKGGGFGQGDIKRYQNVLFLCVWLSRKCKNKNEKKKNFTIFFIKSIILFYFKIFCIAFLLSSFLIIEMMTRIKMKYYKIKKNRELK